MDEDASPNPLDARIQAACEREQFSEAATIWIDELGPEILTFLRAIQSSDIDPLDVFSQFCEDLWRSIPGFRWECSARTWSYRIARSAWYRAQKKARRQREIIPLSEAPAVQAAAERVRTSTAAFRRTEVKDRFRQMRDTLPPDDQMLLILRVDRKLSWLEAARVLLERDGDVSAEDLRTHSARIRKQFQRIKERIRELAESSTDSDSKR